jgi:hypothetical protein
MRYKTLAIAALAIVALLSASACGGSGAGSGQATQSCKLAGGRIRVSVTAGSSALSLANVGVQAYDHDGQPIGNPAPISFADSDGNAISTLAPFKTATITSSLLSPAATDGVAVASCKVTGLGE